ncbi:predicted protein [Postia placenta Mad-698-R]|nr:predicted protein [Postia placenta Mad-698-R]
MAGHASASPASSGSHYPSPETYSDMASSNASPASGSPSLYTPRAHDDPDAASPDTRSPEDPAARPPAEVARAHSAGKGGKKCDEEREGANGACRTCRRLGIDCLGWGAKRPDWMRGNLRMDALTGCPEEAMLALAEISALAHWKMSELRNGSLSVRELIRRGDMIETQLRQRAAPRHAGEGNLTPLDPHLAATTMQFSMTMSGTPSASTSSGVTAHATAISKDEASTVVADIFRETAVLYLHTILSEALPGVPEIHGAIAKIISLLHILPSSEYDRAIIFPLFLTGCMSDDRGVRDMIKRRFLLLDDTFGNIHQVLMQLESIWNERNTMLTHHGGTGIVHWRESLRSQWANLLLL